MQLGSRRSHKGGKLNWTLLTAILGAHHFVVLRDTTFRAPCLPMRCAKMTANLVRAPDGANHACLCTENASHPSPPAIRGETPWLRLDHFRVVRLPFRCLFHHYHVTVDPHCRKCRCCPDRPTLALRDTGMYTRLAELLWPCCRHNRAGQGSTAPLNPARLGSFSCLAPRLRACHDLFVILELRELESERQKLIILWSYLSLCPCSFWPIIFRTSLFRCLEPHKGTLVSSKSPASRRTFCHTSGTMLSP